MARPDALPGGADFSTLSMVSLVGTVLQLAWKGWLACRNARKANYYELIRNPNVTRVFADILLTSDKNEDAEYDFVVLLVSDDNVGLSAEGRVRCSHRAAAFATVSRDSHRRHPNRPAARRAAAPSLRADEAHPPYRQGPQ